MDILIAMRILSSQPLIFLSSSYMVYSNSFTVRKECTMKYLTVGGELSASAISLGFWRTANLDKPSAERLVTTACELGIDFFDTADIYASGESEKLLGRTIHSLGIRDKVKIQTKCAIRKLPIGGAYYDFSKEHILSSVEGSLQRLGTDYIDVLLLHRPDALMEPEEVAEAFSLLYSQGKVRHFGVSNENPQQMKLLHKYLGQKIIANQMQFGLGQSAMIDAGIFVNTTLEGAVDREGGTLDFCRLHDITIQPWSPLQYGFFEGSILDNSEKYADLNKVMDELTHKYNVTKSAIAFAWILRHPAKMQPVAGTTSYEHLVELCAACDVPLTREEWYTLYVSTGKMLP